MAYVIDWTCQGDPAIPGKSAIILNQTTYNSTSTSLILTGKGVENYGEIQQENFIRLLENFANSTAPANPTIGQTWYDTATSSLKVFSGGTTWEKAGVSSGSEISGALGYTPVKSVNSTTPDVNGNVNLTTVGNFTVTGDLTVSGTTTTINSTTLEVADFDLVIAKGANSNATVSGASIVFGNYANKPKILYSDTNDNFILNKRLDATSFYGAGIGLSGTAANLVSGKVEVQDQSNTATGQLPLALVNAPGVDVTGSSNAKCTNKLYYDFSTNSLVNTGKFVGDGSGLTSLPVPSALTSLTISSTTAESNLTLSYTGQTVASYFYKNASHVLGYYSPSIGSIFYIDYAKNMVVGGDITATSDIKLKKDLEKIDNALDRVDKLTGYTFTRIDTGRRQAGLIAQDVQKVLPEAVLEGEYLSVAYGNMMGLVVEAIKELRAEVEAIKAKL